MNIQSSFTINIADIILEIYARDINKKFHVEDVYEDFLSGEAPNLRITVRDEIPDHVSLNEENLIFDSQMAWRLYRVNGEYIFSLFSSESKEIPYTIALFNADFTSGTVYSSMDTCDSHSSQILSNPLRFPLAEILMICLLSKGRGLMVHACGVDDGGRGYLFSGNSSHGKTTMAKLWRNHSHILNDDRIVIRYQGKRFRMYGTPWHGDYRKVSSHGIPLDKIFFLSHDDEHKSNPLVGAAASSQLLRRSFLPLWDTEGISYVLGFCNKIIDNIPCFDLFFKKDESIVKFVRCLE